MVAAYGVFLIDAGLVIFEGLRTYALKWRFNDPVFSVLYESLRQPGPGWDDEALLAARQVSAVLWLAVAAWCVRWRDPVRISFALLGAYVVLSPTVHPWYLLWVLPFLPLFPSPAWLAWSGLVLLAYEVLSGYRETGIWSPAPWALWIQGLTFFGLLLITAAWRRRQERPRHSDVSETGRVS